MCVVCTLCVVACCRTGLGYPVGSQQDVRAAARCPCLPRLPLLPKAAHVPLARYVTWPTMHQHSGVQESSLCSFGHVVKEKMKNMNTKPRR